MDIIKRVTEERQFMIETRRHLHAHPEVSLRERETADYIEGLLRRWGIPCRRAGETGLLGEITGGRGSGKTVLLRADIDALPIEEKTGLPYASQNPGVMHACGHDGHTATLLGAAKVLQAHRDAFSGRVLLVFQPAEEIGQGFRFFLEDHLTDGTDRAFGIHLWPELPSGTVAVSRGADAASVDMFEITIQGKSSHISRPQLGVDALHIACRVAEELRALTTRILSAMDNALVGVGCLHAGSAYNIIPDTAELKGTIRTFSEPVRALLKEQVRQTADRVAALYGGTAETVINSLNGAVVNDSEAVDEVLEVARTIFGANRVIASDTPVMGMAGDDFSEYLLRHKGVYAHVGIARDDNPGTCLPLHNCRFEIDEDALVTAAALHTGYALSVLGAED